ISQDERPPGTDVIDVFVSIDVVEVRAFAARHERGGAAYAAKGANRGIHTARRRILRAGEEQFGLGPRHTRWPRTHFRMKKLMMISCRVPFTLRNNRLFRSRYGWVPANRSCMMSQKRGLRLINSIMRHGTLEKRM